MALRMAFNFSQINYQLHYAFTIKSEYQLLKLISITLLSSLDVFIFQFRWKNFIESANLCQEFLNSEQNIIPLLIKGFVILFNFISSF